MPSQKPAPSAPKHLRVNPIKGRRPVLQNCTIAELLVDSSYQRSLDLGPSKALVRRIAIDWNWSLSQILVVARRPDGGLYVIDGQHRLSAARLRRDIYDLPCVVIESSGPADEAALFRALNQERRPLHALDLFKAALASGDEEALAVMALIEAAGLKLAPHTNLASWKPGVIGNISGIRRAFKEHGADVAARALRILVTAFEGQVLRFAGTIFPGIAAALADPPDGGDDELLVMVLQGDEQPTWAKLVGTEAAERGIHSRDAAAIVIRAAWAEAAAEMVEDA